MIKKRGRDHSLFGINSIRQWLVLCINCINPFTGKSRFDVMF